MATNPKAISKILSDLYRNGLYISLHSSEPGTSGIPKLYGPEQLPRGVLRVSNGVLANPRQVNMPNASNGGRATHIGIWVDRTTFLTSVKLPSPVIVARGAQIQIPTNGFRLGLGRV